MKEYTLNEILNIEKELELIKTKVKLRLNERGMETYVFKKLGVTVSHLSAFKGGKEPFSLKRIFSLAKIIIKKEGKL